MRRLGVGLMVTMAALALLPTAGVAAPPSAPPPLDALSPGERNDIQQDLDVNVVFVGYEGTDVDEGDFLDGLPSTYRPVERFPSFSGETQYLGLTFDFDYDVTYANAAFEDAFFGYLTSISQPAPLTLFQQLYNTQSARSLDIAANSTIDAPSVEQWLADNAGAMLGVDTTEYTIFFIDWYGRADFQHHVYTKLDEPDPDTGVNFGERESRKLIAWGGTTPDDEESGLGSLHRIWFYDLSAGPESWTDNWNVDDADLNGNGATDYRMPPSWEYGNVSAYRPFDDLAGDLAKVARYVAIDLLFTTSPLYDPALSPPLLPDDVQLDVNVYQIDPASDGTDYFDGSLIVEELDELQPTVDYSIELNSLPFKSRFEEVYQCFFDGESCFGQRLFGEAFGDLFLYHQDTLIKYLEGDADYEVPVFAFNATDELFTCCLGYADDNWSDGTQSFVFAFDAPFIRDAGYGFSTTTIHEVGHHVGLSHPHDGYDHESGVDFGPIDDTYFAWSGDQSNSMMSYIDLNWDFSQFDRDNMDRYLTVTYLDEANAILADVLASPRASQVEDLVASADDHAEAALVAYDGMSYRDAVAQAKAAYDDVLAAAAAINVPVEPQAWQADYKAKGRSGAFVDPAEGQRFKP